MRWGERFREKNGRDRTLSFKIGVEDRGNNVEKKKRILGGGKNISRR